MAIASPQDGPRRAFARQVVGCTVIGMRRLGCTAIDMTGILGACAKLTVEARPGGIETTSTRSRVQR
jgi:hypothetical protein